jgi:hypothetical protein
MKIALPLVRYDTDRKKASFFDEVVQRLRTPPGVRDATMAASLPTTMDQDQDNRRGKTTAVGFEPAVFLCGNTDVTPGYFHTLRIPLTRGREFTARDNSAGAPAVMMISESLARVLWPESPKGANPVGRHISEGYDKLAAWIEIVGVVADIHEGGLAFGAVPEFYLPSALHPPQTAYLVAQ